jgi:hypothetical protein
MQDAFYEGRYLPAKAVSWPGQLPLSFSFISFHIQTVAASLPRLHRAAADSTQASPDLSLLYLASISDDDISRTKSIPFRVACLLAERNGSTRPNTLPRYPNLPIRPNCSY